VPYTVYFDGGSAVVRIDQQSNGGQWILLGTWNFYVGTAGTNVYISNDCDGYKMMDAIKWVPA
jgi:hypothetical protein